MGFLSHGWVNCMKMDHSALQDFLSLFLTSLPEWILSQTAGSAEARKTTLKLSRIAFSSFDLWSWNIFFRRRNQSHIASKLSNGWAFRNFATAIGKTYTLTSINQCLMESEICRKSLLYERVQDPATLHHNQSWTCTQNCWAILWDLVLSIFLLHT